MFKEEGGVGKFSRKYDNVNLGNINFEALYLIIAIYITILYFLMLVKNKK